MTSRVKKPRIKKCEGRDPREIFPRGRYLEEQSRGINSRNYFRDTTLEEFIPRGEILLLEEV